MNAEKKYLNRLTNHIGVRQWKLVQCSQEESWHPNWSRNKFLVMLSETFSDYKKPKRSKTYYIYCCGMDDDEMAIRNLSWSVAEKLFDKATIDGTSKETLKSLGILQGI